MSSIWDDIPSRPFLRYEDGVVVVRFESDEPVRTTNKYNQPQWNFEVNGDMLFGVSSKGLMRLLKKHLPLTGKTLKITRSGRGFETSYQVEEVEHP